MDGDRPPARRAGAPLRRLPPRARGEPARRHDGDRRPLRGDPRARGPARRAVRAEAGHREPRVDAAGAARPPALRAERPSRPLPRRRPVPLDVPAVRGDRPRRQDHGPRRERHARRPHRVAVRVPARARAPGAARGLAHADDGRRRGDGRRVGHGAHPRRAAGAGGRRVHDRRARVARRPAPHGEGEVAVQADRRAADAPRRHRHGRRRDHARGRGAPGGAHDHRPARRVARRPRADPRRDGALLAQRVRRRAPVAVPPPVDVGRRDPRRHQGERRPPPLRGRGRLPPAVRHHARGHQGARRAPARRGGAHRRALRAHAPAVQRELHGAGSPAGGRRARQRDGGGGRGAAAHRDVLGDRRALLPAAGRPRADLRPEAPRPRRAGRVHHRRRPRHRHQGAPGHRPRRRARRAARVWHGARREPDAAAGLARRRE